MRSVVIRSTGGPEVFEIEERDIPIPGKGEVLIRIKAAGINFIDIYQRRVLYPVELPYYPGLEGGGTAEAMGDAVESISAGDSVAFCSSPGSYAEYVVVPESKLVKIPAELDMPVGVAAMLQGLTAHYLTQSTFKLNSGHMLLIHAAAGGVGRLVTQIGKMVGAEVIGTVSTSEKEQVAREAGADHIIRYTEEDLEERVKEITEGRGVDVVYDSVGEPTFEKSLKCLKMRGMMVSFGQSGGPVAPINTQILNANGSLFLTRPSLFHYIADVDTLRSRADDVFRWIQNGNLKILIDSTFGLDQVGQAHSKLESRGTMGKVLLAT